MLQPAQFVCLSYLFCFDKCVGGCICAWAPHIFSLSDTKYPMKKRMERIPCVFLSYYFNWYMRTSLNSTRENKSKKNHMKAKDMKMSLNSLEPFYSLCIQGRIGRLDESSGFVHFTMDTVSKWTGLLRSQSQPIVQSTSSMCNC